MLYIETLHIPDKSEIRYNWDYPEEGSYELTGSNDNGHIDQSIESTGFDESNTERFGSCNTQQGGLLAPNFENKSNNSPYVTNDDNPSLNCLSSECLTTDNSSNSSVRSSTTNSPYWSGYDTI